MKLAAKVIKSGKSQAIRLPREIHLSSDEVQMERVPGGIFISTMDPWDACQQACEGISEEVIHALVHRNDRLTVENRNWANEP